MSEDKDRFHLIPPKSEEGEPIFPRRKEFNLLNIVRRAFGDAMRGHGNEADLVRLAEEGITVVTGPGLTKDEQEKLWGPEVPPVKKASGPLPISQKPN